MVRRLGLGKNNHLTYASLALNPRYEVPAYCFRKIRKKSQFSCSNALDKNGIFFFYINVIDFSLTLCTSAHSDHLFYSIDIQL